MCSRVWKFSTVQLEIATDWVGDLCFVTHIHNPNWWSLCGWENSCPLSVYVCSCWRSLLCWSLFFLVVSRFGVFDSGSTYMTEWERCLFPTFWSSSQHKHKVVCCVFVCCHTLVNTSRLLSTTLWSLHSPPHSIHLSTSRLSLSLSLSLSLLVLFVVVVFCVRLCLCSLAPIVLEYQRNVFDCW